MFFVDKWQEWPADKLTELRTALLEFLKACRMGIDKHEEICKSEHDYAFQASLETGFIETKSKMDSHWKEYNENK